MEPKEFTSGALRIYQREAWVEKTFTRVKSFIASYGDKAVSTSTSLCVTSLKNSYVRGQIFPFINIPIRYREKELLGLYEYFGEQLPFSEQHIYCDIVIHSIYYVEKKDPALIKALEEQAQQIFRMKNYDIISFEDGMATMTIERSILDGEEFIVLLKGLLDEAIKMQSETE